MNPDVDAYIRNSDKWPEVITALRPILTTSGLTEEIKWGKPCYTHEGKNVAIVQEMKDFLALMFFKGTLLADPRGILEDQGPNSRSARRMCFTTVEDVTRLAAAVEEYVAEAIAVEQAGTTVGPPREFDLVSELRDRLDGDPALAAAFEALTPGRRREYNLYIAGAKQPTTRETRVDKCTPRILTGRGLRDR